MKTIPISRYELCKIINKYLDFLISRQRITSYRITKEDMSHLRLITKIVIYNNKQERKLNLEVVLKCIHFIDTEISRRKKYSSHNKGCNINAIRKLRKKFIIIKSSLDSFYSEVQQN